MSNLLAVARKLLYGLAVLAVSLVVLVELITYLEARDNSQVSQPGRRAAGATGVQRASGPTGSARRPANH